MSRLSLLWKIMLSTSVALTALFALTGWIVQTSMLSTASQTLDEEVRASFQAYESLWKSRAELLSSVSLILSTMSDVRAAFSTGDAATIRDTAGELWSRISDQSAMFLVTDPHGRVIASLGGAAAPSLRSSVDAVRVAQRDFPRQATGFLLGDGLLYQIAVTPVYVQTGRGAALLNVLVAGYAVDALLAQRLKQATGGSEFLFLSGGRVAASTVNPRATAVLAASVKGREALDRVSDGVIEYVPRMRPLLDIGGQRIGELWILRSFEGAQQRLVSLRRNMILVWGLAVVAGLALTYVLARKIVKPVKELDRAAAEVARQNYDCRVKVESQDELGRLARTFNDMCASIRQGREELIHQERIATIGRLSSSIVHDLRNPLAAVYGGAEMLVDSDLPPHHVKRLAGNIYRASRRIQELLQDLLNVSRGKRGTIEVCSLREVVGAAAEALGTSAEAQSVAISNEVPEGIELPLERSRMERVFVNLVSNAIEAMPDGGRVTVRAAIESHQVLVEVCDTGPGIPDEVRACLFQPFASAGKKTGLGLGLTLSRQTVMDHGGDLWADEAPGRGACFRMRLPLSGRAGRQVA